MFIKLTAALKTWAIDNLDVESDADDAAFKSAIANALVDEKLDMAQLQKLSETEETKAANQFADTLNSLTKSVSALQARMDSSASAGDSSKGASSDADDAGKEGDKGASSAPTKAPLSGLQKVIKGMGTNLLSDDSEEKGFDIIVKEAVDMYSDTKSTLTYPERTEKGVPHAFAGQPVQDFANEGKTLSSPSEKDLAIAGAYAKFTLAASKTGSKQIAFSQLPEHDRQLLFHAMENEKWGGASDGGDLADIKGRKLTGLEQKALIDDATSGGLEAAPIVFDDLIIQTPLLYGELFPKVNTIPLDRGRRIEGVATGTVTGGWGGVDDSAISLFNTASYVSAFDTTIHRWEGSFRIGLDFLSDTPIDFGRHVTTQYGERLLEDLDDVIATGNGTNQPEGVMNKSGTTSVNFGGSTSLGNYESLRFGVSKAEHKANLMKTACFCGTETSYQRARAIPVGASDARRLGGMNYDSYQWMERPYSINESLTNAQVFYAILGRYRMYRRRGLTMRTSTEGDTLIRRNEMLIVATARYGGQLERGAVAAVTTTAPA